MNKIIIKTLRIIGCIALALVVVVTVLQYHSLNTVDNDIQEVYNDRPELRFAVMYAKQTLTPNERRDVANEILNQKLEEETWIKDAPRIYQGLYKYNFRNRVLHFNE